MFVRVEADCQYFENSREWAALTFFNIYLREAHDIVEEVDDDTHDVVFSLHEKAISHYQYLLGYIHY
jgi:hypothetical protein